MAAKILLFILPFSILCYDLGNIEEKPFSGSIKIDRIVLNNIYNGKLIGCKYQNLCPIDRVCYNDKLFGTCMMKADDANFIYELASEFQNILELAMRDLFEENYKWGDFYTQCFLQSVLISSELQQFLDVRHCKPRSDALISVDPKKMKPERVEVNEDIDLEVPRIYTRAPKSQDSETFYNNIKSMLQQIQDEKRIDSNYNNKEMINPKSNSEEANSVTKVNYADPKVIRKVLKVAKRISNDWIWLRFNKKISKLDEPKIVNSIINSMSNPMIIEKSKWNADKSIFYFKLLSDSFVHSENVTNFFNNHKSIIPGFTILESGSSKISGEIEEESPSDQNFIITLIICSVVFLGVILVLIGFCVQKFRYKRDKLGDIIKSKFSDNSSASYKELFRVTTNKDTAAVKSKQGVAKMNNKQHSGDTPAASSPVSTRSSTSSWTDEIQAATNMDIYTGHMILSYMEKHLKNKEIFQSEWNSILSYEVEDARTDAAIKIENLPKNRYQDKIPYDKSRVVLKNQKDGDYINASLIMDHDPKIPVYIATQAPLEKMMADFWQMVWEQGVVVIVNLTEINEVECSQYWPKEGSQIFNIYEVNLVSEHIWSDEYLVRNFYLKNLDTAETRTVTQFHFVSWPVDKLPSSSRSILEFRRKVNKSYRSKSTPIIIHCNDGCGRTGTYILLDLILNRICKGLKEMDIAATLEHLRDQRMHLVKTEEQFGFVLTTISEEVNNILKILNQ